MLPSEWGLGRPHAGRVGEGQGRRLLFSRQQCLFRTIKEAVGKFCKERALLEPCYRF